MGSVGWVQCYWCDAWTFDPYALDLIGGNFLCDGCWDVLFPDDESPAVTRCPTEPNALTRRARTLRRLFHRMPVVEAEPVVAIIIASFLVEDWRR